MSKENFFKLIRANLFGGKMTQAQVDGVSVILSATIDMPISHRAYILATAFHETGARMQPVRETFATSDQQAVNRLETAWAKGQLPWVRTPYWRFDSSGKAWFGRGYPQLTHKENYAKSSPLAGVDLLSDPNLMLMPDIAVKVMVKGMQQGTFTGKSLDDYLPGDYAGARRIINGTESARKVATYAKTFEAALSTITDESKPDSGKVVVPEGKSILKIILELIGAIWKKLA